MITVSIVALMYRSTSANAAASSPRTLCSASNACVGANGIADPMIADDRSAASRISTSSASIPAKSPSRCSRLTSSHHSCWSLPRT